GCGDGGTSRMTALQAPGGACTSPADCMAGLLCNDDPGGQCTKACQTDADCTGFPGAICEPGGGNCYHQCQTSADCTRAGCGCVGGAPGHRFCDPLHEVGDSCTTAADCVPGLDCNEDPGGQCTKACQTDAECPSGSVCETPGNCYHQCTSKADCPRDGY